MRFKQPSTKEDFLLFFKQVLASIARPDREPK